MDMVFLYIFVEGAGDDFILLGMGQLDKVDGIAGNTDGQLRIQFGVSLRVQQSVAVEHIDVEVVRLLPK